MRVLKVIAAWQVAAGVVLAGFVLWSVGHGTRYSWEFTTLVEAIVAAAVYGGIALWRGKPPGLLFCGILQLLQIVAVFTGRFAFELLMGPRLALVFPTGGNVLARADLRTTLTFYAGDAPAGLFSGYVVNLIAMGVFVLLIREQSIGGQPLLRARDASVRWDRARIIGAYQIGAGVLGITNSMNAEAHALGNLILSIVVLASGVALVRRMRWSDGIAVAVNAIQVPVAATADWSFFLRSGASCVLAFVSGEHSGIRLQFDVGSVINTPLAPGVDGFAGINLVALALAILLVNYERV